MSTLKKSFTYDNSSELLEDRISQDSWIVITCGYAYQGRSGLGFDI